MFSPLSLLAGRRHSVDVLTLMRGENHAEKVEDGTMVVFAVVRGAATISRPRSADKPGIYLHVRRGAPVWLTTPGTYSVVAKEATVAMRVRRAGGADK